MNIGTLIAVLGVTARHAHFFGGGVSPLLLPTEPKPFSAVDVRDSPLPPKCRKQNARTVMLVSTEGSYIYNRYGTLAF